MGRVIRGEIWMVAGGVYASKPRPAVILQDDRFDGTDSVTVCPLTSIDVSAPLLRLPLEADVLSGLDAASFVMVDKLTTVRRANVAQRVGRLSSSQLVDLERLVMVFLGLAD
jgi:mRNA interferase MazF